ncbi:MAG: BrnT family toxin [Acidobacteria bacterium]|nr:BrnT family toxin [Acidobacteriota bacterium]
MSFETAVRAFDDERAIPFADPEHSRVGEPRYALLGMCESGLVFISFTYRGSRTRIISARRASRRMERIYAGNE